MADDDHRHPAHAVLVQALAPRLTPEQTAHRGGAEHLAHEAVIALNTAGLLRTGTDLTGHLEGATERPGEGERVSTPGQYAAMWNGMTPQSRQTLLQLHQRNGDDALRCMMEDHDDELLALRGRLTAVLALHPPKDRADSMVLWCDHDENPWPCPTARAAGVPTADTEQIYAGLRIRAVVDAIHPRVNADGSINADHVAAESTLRDREGLPGFIAELDGPGKYRP